MKSKIVILIAVVAMVSSFYGCGKRETIESQDAPNKT